MGVKRWLPWLAGGFGVVVIGLYALAPRQVELRIETEIEAPAETVWKILAHDFAAIADWSDTVTESRVVGHDELPDDVTVDPDAPVPARATVAGPGIAFTEAIVDYSDEEMSLTFAGVNLPVVFESATDTQSVTALGPNRSLLAFDVVMRPAFVLKPVTIVLGPRVRSTFSSIQAELKAHAEAQGG